MTKLTFTQEELLAEYKKDLNDLLDECDWIDTVDDWRLCSLVSSICNKNGLEVDGNKLLKLYNKKVKLLKLTHQEWCEQYASWGTGMPKIIGLLYEIIENKFGSSE